MERFTTLCAAAALLVAAGVGLAEPVRAQVAPQTIPGILCDTEAQVRSIVSANQQSNRAMQDAFHQLNAQLNPKNQPVCSVQDMQHTLLSVPKSIDVGPWPENGQLFEAFILRLQVDTVDGWFLYLAPRDAGGSGSGSGDGGSKA